jgi:hypothetical protein
MTIQTQQQLFQGQSVPGRPFDHFDPELGPIRKALPKDWNSQYPVQIVPDYHGCCDVEVPAVEQIKRAIKALGCSGVADYEARFVRPLSQWQKLAFQFVKKHFEGGDHRVLIIETGRHQLFSGMEQYIFRRRSAEVITLTQNSYHIFHSPLVVHLLLETSQGLFKACIHRESSDLFPIGPESP